MYMMILTRAIKRDSTEMTTLKLVMLRKTGQLWGFGMNDLVDIQLTPWQRLNYRSVVRRGVDQFTRVAVPSMVRPFLPQLGAIQIWCCNAIQSQSCDGDGQFEREATDQRFWSSPLPLEGMEAGRYPHAGGNGFPSRNADL